MEWDIDGSQSAQNVRGTYTYPKQFEHLNYVVGSLSPMEHINIGIIFLCTKNSQWCVYSTKSRVLQAAGW